MKILFSTITAILIAAPALAQHSNQTADGANPANLKAGTTQDGTLLGNSGRPLGISGDGTAMSSNTGMVTSRKSKKHHRAGMQGN